MLLPVLRFNAPSSILLNTETLADFLVARVREDREEGTAGRAGLLISTVNGVAVAESPISRALLDAGFVSGAKGFNVRRTKLAAGIGIAARSPAMP
jgi:hypothetical protein